MSAKTSRNSTKILRAVIVLMMVQAVMPWSWVHAQMMASVADHDIPPCHTMALVSHDMTSDVAQAMADTFDVSEHTESVCERACALSQVTLPLINSFLKTQLSGEALDYAGSVYLSHPQKVPTPPPII